LVPWRCDRGPYLFAVRPFWVQRPSGHEQIHILPCKDANLRTSLPRYAHLYLIHTCPAHAECILPQKNNSPHVLREDKANYSMLMC